MVEAGAVAIVGPKSFHVADVVASICNELNVPHLVSYQRASDINANVYHQFTRNIAPDPTLLSDALVDVVEKFDWPKFAVIYDSDESLVRLNGILQMFQSGYKAVTIYKYPGKDMVKQMLKDIDKSIEHRVIIDCSNENIAEILKQGLNMGKQEYMVRKYKFTVRMQWKWLVLRFRVTSSHSRMVTCWTYRRKLHQT